MFKKFTCCLICLLLAALPLLGLAETSFVMMGFDGEDSTHDWTTNRFFERMNQRTGVSFTFQQVNSAEEWTVAKKAIFEGGAQMPDVLFKAALNSEELIRYTESGQLIDLKPLLEEHAPNLWKLLQENPDWLDAITLPSGKIGALPAIQPNGPVDALWINKTWLEALKLQVPTDMESLRNVLTMFRDRDPNKNGKQDEIPLAFLGPWELKLFSHAWGVVANDYNIYLDENGKVQFWPYEDSFFELAAVMRDFYDEGLLDPDGFATADTLRRITDDDATQIYGAFFAPTPLNLVTYSMAEEYVIVDPFVYEGKQIYRDLFGDVTRGAFAITSACKDPAALLRWVDVLYTEEGAIEAMVGIEGEDYIVGADGKWNWKGGTDSMDMLTMSDMSIYDTGDMPWMFPLDFYSRYADHRVGKLNDELNRLSTMTVQPFPMTYTLTADERAQVLALQNELAVYVDVTLARFVLSEMELNEDTIASVRSEMQNRGMNEMIAFWQKIADR